MVYLKELRGSIDFQQLLSEIEIPQIPCFNPGKASRGGTWEYWSGRKDGFDAVLSLLKGTKND